MEGSEIVIHISKQIQLKSKKTINVTVCTSVMVALPDTLTEAALSSDCDACRNRVGVGGKGEKTWEGRLLGVRPEPDYAVEPMGDADAILDDVKERRR